jgi:4-amino-4-deoxy-L-arabinose transferase-like glycosyltransferase
MRGMKVGDGTNSLLPDRAGAMLIGALSLLLCWDLGRVELSVTDEARSAVIVRDMVEGGRWLLPRTPDGYLCEKPLAYYSACALLGSVFGINEWTLRGVSVAMGAGMLLMTWILTRLYGPPRAAGIAVLALAANALFVSPARDALVDMTLAFFLTAGLTAYLAARQGRMSPWSASALCGVAFGLATLSKGPLGIAFPVAVAGGDALIEHRGRFWRAVPWWKHGLVALLLAVAVSCAWYVPGYLRGGREFLDTCLLSENFQMPLGAPKGIGVSHKKDPFYYFGVQLAVVLPLLPLLPGLVGWARDPAAGAARRHLPAWIAFGFLIFEISANKRMYYLIPLQPAIAVMIGLASERARSAPDSGFLKISSLVTGILVVGLSLGAASLTIRPSLAGGTREGTVSEALSRHRAAIGAAALLALGVGAALISASRRGPEAAIRASAALGVVTIAVSVLVGTRLEAEFNRTRPFIASVVPKLPPGRVPDLVPPIRGYSLEFYWPQRLSRDERAVESSEYLLLARTSLPRVAGPYATLGLWKYGPEGRNDVLLVHRDPSHSR